MKFKYNRCFPLSLALVTMPVLVSHAQNPEEAPVPGAEEKLQEEPVDPGDASETVVRKIEEARLRLAVARRSAEAATGDEKTRALAEVEEAEKQLIAAMERGDAMVAKDAPFEGEEKSGSNDRDKDKDQEEKNSDKNPESAGAPEDAKEGKEAADAADPKEASPAPEMKPEKEKPSPRAEPGKDGEDAKRPDKKKEKAADEDQEAPKVPEVSKPEPKMEPVSPPRNEETPQAIVETQEEIEEAKEADQAVEVTTQKVEQEADRRKLNLKDEGAARDLIRDLIGSESEVSKAEAARETRLEPRFRGNGRDPRQGENRDEIRVASEFLLRQLSGTATAAEAPAFFRRPAETDPRIDQRGDLVDPRNEPSVVRELAPPRYYHEGRRYVRFDSRNSVPAILLAAASLDRVVVQPANLTDGYFPADQGRDQYANELPPENFRGDDAVVVSYPVSKASMISSNDIIFAQGSTRFADRHSYDMVLALADAMANPALKDARFVIEGHASAEGSYEENMVLSQRRAETIVRDMVREGIDPERLIPVGYGESEARYPADSPERLRSLDRSVKVFRTGAE